MMRYINSATECEKVESIDYLLLALNLLIFLPVFEETPTLSDFYLLSFIVFS